MAANFRAYGHPTPDRVENLRRAERSAWHTHIDAREAVALMPPRHPGLELARERVWRTERAWRETLRALDAGMPT